ncbi:GyrI-like domain-containing protein [Gramella sp. KN1008]|uniref:GyrI-like domain-containing protein n=1 Tax=Gramella sp. KN1008 TaxID=2529298 RepID=UPI00103D608A|nr:GyrI-like domain-containing protein [Gramella sp. KN1008]TBW29298.1 AraC family transcriptional regulator [Gramella sp. KN1008]
MQQPEIKEIEEKKLVGIKVSTTLADDKTSLLWKRFMQSRDAIKNNKNEDLYSVQIYGEKFMKEEFDSQSVFEKWAAMETEDHSFIPKGLQKLELPAGLYAVFIHHGTANEFAETAKFIFEDWLPSSQYVLDNRPHFEVLGEEYKGPDNPDSMERIWIPVKEKS